MALQTDDNSCRIYDAEHRWRTADHHRTVRMDLSTMRALVEGVVTSPWWRRRYGRQEAPRVRGHETATEACYSRRANLMYFGADARQPWVMCHELAHVAVPRDANDDPHGPDFAAEYLAIVAAVLGDRAAEHLAEMFQQYGVTVRWS